VSKPVFLKEPNPIAYEKHFSDNWARFEGILKSRIKGYDRTKAMQPVFKHIFKVGFGEGMKQQYLIDVESLEEQTAARIPKKPVFKELE
jgi:hypothetical protein